MISHESLQASVMGEFEFMGLDAPSIKFLCAAKSLGVDFSRTATIGRQSFFPDATSLGSVFTILGNSQNAEEFIRENKFSETFLQLLGAREVTSIDYSSYEGADIVHDMNSPIPGDFRQRYSVVHDGGTLEHVFNAPQAFKNCMEMVQVGGHFTQVNEANNFMGHGFWQFSPELIFRMFSPENGYQIEAVLLHEVTTGGRWYLVADPDAVQSRVELCNSVPTYICTIARRVADSEIFRNPPLQSDYVAAWDRQSKNNGNSPADSVSGKPPADSVSNGLGRASLREAVKSLLPGPAKRALRGIRRRLTTPRSSAVTAPSGGFNQSYYKEISEDAVLRGHLNVDRIHSLPETGARPDGD